MYRTLSFTAPSFQLRQHVIEATDPVIYVARFAEISDRGAAEALRGTELTVPRSALPPLGEGEYYHVDLIDLPCASSTGEALGAVVAVENFGAGDIVEVQRASGKRFMVPMHAVTLGDGGATIDAAFVE